MKRLFFSIVLMSVMVMSYGQDIRGPISNPAPGVLDGVYVKEHIPTKKVVPYEFVREADVAWSKRVWRVIDMREKFNHPLYYPLDDFQDGMDPTNLEHWMRNPTRWSLWTIIRYHIMKGDLTLYSPFDPNWQAWRDGDLFKYPFTRDEWGDPNKSTGNFFNDSIYRESVKEYQYLGKELIDPNRQAYVNQYGYDSTITLPDGTIETVYPPNEFEWYKSEDIVQYRIKEDWFFDNERSVMDVRIIGICPVIYERDDNGNITGLKELVWLYFPECRYVFQNFYVQNRHNDSQRMSFDDLFWKRMFRSYIYKETNLYDRELQNYRAGVEALLEAERIKEKIMNFEHDLWSF
ncbi:MAG: gliding motility protein GldN [Crocinitomicaceae bacterium]